MPETLLVIGVHRDERAFGEAVARHLDPTRFATLRIAEGISGMRPRPEEREAFLLRHGALYGQILDHVEPHHRRLIDLHSGIDAQGLSADVFSGDPATLVRIAGEAMALAAPVRCIRLVADTAAEADDAHAFPVALAEIPQAIWCEDRFAYLGIEVYLATQGAGTEAEAAFAESLIEAVVRCTLPHGSRTTAL
ncbi:hypothetical protein GGD81_004494 [Rhodobium orientis]|uniref:Uncharacterized protein n=1 Tax=Rhodobium orientis TaxID=34017 RepID=A0A327JIG0_9HYPH|nr:hypothetical protein [Rhodobium orientis]MBB4305417.1 hypothetical protein [Rhodobium orientis]MBK5948326.1 hypothetical protein [Rhodobium orientis]RAI25506.1 hypothetical protein CH339_17975 [Rhodobium orientis]